MLPHVLSLGSELSIAFSFCEINGFRGITMTLIADVLAVSRSSPLHAFQTALVPYVDDLMRHVFTTGLSLPNLSHQLAQRPDLNQAKHVSALLLLLHVDVLNVPHRISTATKRHLQALYLEYVDAQDRTPCVRQATYFMCLTDIVCSDAMQDFEPSPVRVCKIIGSGDMDFVSDLTARRALNFTTLFAQARAVVLDIALHDPSPHDGVDILKSLLSMTRRTSAWTVVRLMNAIAVYPPIALPQARFFQFMSDTARSLRRELALVKRSTETRRDMKYASNVEEITTRLQAFVASVLNTTLIRNLDPVELLRAPEFMELVADSFVDMVSFQGPLAVASNNTCTTGLRSILLFLVDTVSAARVQERIKGQGRLTALLHAIRACEAATASLRDRGLEERAANLILLRALSPLKADQDRFAALPTANRLAVLRPRAVFTPTHYNTRGVLRSTVCYMGLIELPMMHLVMLSARFSGPVGTSQFLRAYVMGIGEGSRSRTAIAGQRLGFYLRSFEAYTTAVLETLRTLNRRPELPFLASHAVAIVSDFILFIRRACRSYTLARKVDAKLGGQGKRAQAFVSRRLGGVDVDFDVKDLVLSRDEERIVQRLADIAEKAFKELRGGDFVRRVGSGPAAGSG